MALELELEKLGRDFEEKESFVVRSESRVTTEEDDDEEEEETLLTELKLEVLRCGGTYDIVHRRGRLLSRHFVFERF